jgi:hypothetical protein
MQENGSGVRNRSLPLSMSGRGSCFDKAIVETFVEINKADLVWRRTWETCCQGEATFIQYMKRSHNPTEGKPPWGQKPAGFWTPSSLNEQREPQKHVTRPPSGA